MIDSQRTLAPRSRALEALDFRDGMVLEPSTGNLVARSGQRFTWTRGGNTLVSVAATGGTYTAAATVPAWTVATVSGTTQLGLRLGTSDVVAGAADVPWITEAVCGELLFVEQGARTTANATLFAVAGSDPTTGARLYLDTSGTYYGFTAHNGTTTATARLTSGQPTTGDVVRLLFEWQATGLTVRQSINGGAETTATAGAVSLPTTVSTGLRTRIGRRGATANPAALTFLRLLIVPGTLAAANLDEGY